MFQTLLVCLALFYSDNYAKSVISTTNETYKKSMIVSKRASGLHPVACTLAVAYEEYFIITGFESIYKYHVGL